VWQACHTWLVHSCTTSFHDRRCVCQKWCVYEGFSLVCHVLQSGQPSGVMWLCTKTDNFYVYKTSPAFAHEQYGDVLDNVSAGMYALMRQLGIAPCHRCKDVAATPQGGRARR